MLEIPMSASEKRRLIACCDGTWNKPDSRGGSTNVIRLARAIKPADRTGISQIIYYHPGVGVGNFVDRWIGGGTGVGLSGERPQHIRILRRQLPGRG
jgi:hypothetical protein